MWGVEEEEEEEVEEEEEEEEQGLCWLAVVVAWLHSDHRNSS
jgi:hypothetical protein